MVFPVMNITYKGFSRIFHDLVPFKPIVLKDVTSWCSSNFFEYFDHFGLFGHMFGGSFSGHQQPGNGDEGGASVGRSSAVGRPVSQAIGGSDAVTVPGFNMNGTNGTGKTWVFSMFFWWFCWSRTFLDSHFPGSSVFHLGRVSTIRKLRLS